MFEHKRLHTEQIDGESDSEYRHAERDEHDNRRKVAMGHEMNKMHYNHKYIIRDPIRLKWNTEQCRIP